MSKRNEHLHLGPRPLLDAAVDLREQLRDARQRPGIGIRMAVLLLGVAVTLNTVWVLGSVRPRLADAEAAVQAAHVAQRDLLGENALFRLQNDNLNI